MTVNLSTEPDKFVWSLTPSGVFSVKSMYADFMDGQTVFRRKYIWKLKIPSKVKKFMWFLDRQVILTKDNLAKRNWQGSLKCCFCDADESIQHLFLSCHLARIIWRIIFITFNFPPPTSITNLFGNWLNGVEKKLKAHMRMGVSAFCWAI